MSGRKKTRSATPAKPPVAPAAQVAEQDSENLQIAGISVPPGTRARIDLPLGRRVTGAQVALPIEVVNGAEPGPRLFVCAAIHGDEINGVEIIRRVLRHRGLRAMRGALIAVPVVNLFGFVGLKRYLPDRRDLNRCFPGSPDGSLAGRLANVFMTNVVGNSTHGIDLHTAAVHRSNLPQIRACLSHEPSAQMARAFGAPVIIDANVRDGSLRQSVLEREIPMLLYEGGEALRYDEQPIRAGLRGVLAVMHHLGMFDGPSPVRGRRRPFVARSSSWVRAPEAGLLRTRAKLGSAIEKGGRLGIIADPLGSTEVEVCSPRAGVVIGRSELPVVNEGDAIFHVASFDMPEQVASSVEQYQEDLDVAERLRA